MASSTIKLKFFEDLLTKTTLSQLAKEVESYRETFTNPGGQCIISEAAAILAVAKDKYNLAIENYSPQSDLVIKPYDVHELTVDMDSQIVSVRGEVDAVYDTKSFKKKDGTLGCFTSIKLKDLSTEAITYVKFWNKRKEDLLKHFKEGDKLLLESFKVNVFQNYPNLNHQRMSKLNHLGEVS